MAIVHKATLTPTKAELIGGWLPNQPWYDGPVPPKPRPVGSFRIDDPAGEVGVETILAEVADGSHWHIPMTYRAAPLDDDSHLIGVLEHSVLGTRYVYDAIGDPVYRAVVADTITGGGRQAQQLRDNGDGTIEPVPVTMTSRGTGGGDGEVQLVRRPTEPTGQESADGSGVLLGALVDGPDLVLARLA